MRGGDAGVGEGESCRIGVGGCDLSKVRLKAEEEFLVRHKREERSMVLDGRGLREDLGFFLERSWAWSSGP